MWLVNSNFKFFAAPRKSMPPWPCPTTSTRSPRPGSTIKLFNVNDGAVLRTFKHHTETVWRLALMPDGLRFVSGSADKTARIAYHGLAP